MLFLLLPMGMALATPVPNLAKRSPTAQYTISQPFTYYSSGASFTSLDNSVDFSMQLDGNFVVYQNGVAQWNSQTGGHDCNSGNCWLNWQTDGNLVVYIKGGKKAAWASNTAGTGKTLYLANQAPYILIRDSKGNAVWSTPRPVNPPPECTKNPCP